MRKRDQIDIPNLVQVGLDSDPVDWHLGADLHTFDPALHRNSLSKLIGEDSKLSHTKRGC